MSSQRPDEGGEEGEDSKERVDRELIELLNELRVALPGVQILFAFMLTVPFSQGFAKLTSFERWVYFAAFVTAAMGTALLIAPSSYHRLRFRKGDKEQMLYTSNRLLLCGMGFVAASMALSVGLISEFVFGTTTALIAGIGIGGWLIWFWYGLPLTRRVKQDRAEE